MALRAALTLAKRASLAAAPKVCFSKSSAAFGSGGGASSGNKWKRWVTESSGALFTPSKRPTTGPSYESSQLVAQPGGNVKISIRRNGNASTNSIPGRPEEPLHVALEESTVSVQTTAAFGNELPNDSTKAQALDDNTYNEICEELVISLSLPDQEALVKVYNKVATTWVQAIQKATIVELTAEDKWKDDKGLIQWKRMTKADLDTNVEVPRNEHAYEDVLDVIKLPHPVPESNRSNEVNQFLFVRPDDYELFAGVNDQNEERHNTILMGNPGISKSWFQWKYILFCYRTDLYEQLWKKGYPKTVQDRCVYEPLNMKIPQAIVRTTAGEESYLFFIGRSNDVLNFQHHSFLLKKITNEEMVILWEPSSSSTPVYYSGIQARIIATVSPNEDRYKEFAKQECTKTLYMPCPSELQLRLMGNIFRMCNQNLGLSDKEIHERVMKYGPFIRTVLTADDEIRNKYIINREKELRGSDSNVLRKLTSPSHIETSTQSVLDGFSHRVARYVVNREEGYRHCYFQFTSKEVLHRMREIIETMSILKR